MAILNKRTSGVQVPQIDARRPLTSTLDGVGSIPALSGRYRVNPITAGGGSAPSVGGGSLPGVQPSLTSSGSGAPRPTVTSTNRPTNSSVNPIVKALTGAAVGAGGKFLLDKILTPGAPKPPNSGVTPPNSGGVRPPNSGGAPPNSGVTRPPTSVVRPPVAATPARTPTTGGAPAGSIPIKTPTSSGGAGGLGGDGSSSDGSDDLVGRADGVAYDDDGNLMPGYELDENNNPVWVGLDGSPSTVFNPDGSSDTIVGGSEEPQYSEDADGNIYVLTPDGEYELYQAADAEELDAEEAVADASEEDPAEVFAHDADGNLYILNADGEYVLYQAAEDTVSEDVVSEDVVAGDSFDDSAVVAGDSFDDSGDDTQFVKRGGLMTMMKKGGVAKFGPGGFVDNGDGTYNIGSDTYEMETGELITSGDYDSYDLQSPVRTTFAEPDFSPTNFPAYDDDGSLLPGYQLDANNDPVWVGYAQYDPKNYDTYDLQGPGNYPWSITSPGSGAKPTTPPSDWANFKGFTGDALNALTGALGTTTGAAGAGALVATLLGQDFSGGTGNQNKGVDMSKVGAINPRTTNFGIGPANFVGYQDYGTSGGAYKPNDELLHNLNAPGYNEVNQGDYAKAAPRMASGGLSSMATPVASYYTFGQPADILANLGMRPQPPENPPESMPQIGQQQPGGSPQQQPPQQGQMPPQGQMPQGQPQPMRRGGLPHASNVPIVQGRMDFRQGAAVHGEGDGQSDDIPAMLADGEYVIDSETVAQIGNGSTKAGARALDKFREGIRAHKRSAPINKIPPKTKPLTSYLKGAR